MKFRDQKDMPSSGGANYVKLKDGEKIHGIFMGDIHEFNVMWKNSKAEEVPEGHPNGKFRFRINFMVKEGAVYVPKVFEQGLKVYKDLADLHEIYPLDKTLVQISRKGNSVNDTTYSIMPMPQKISEETLAHIKTIKLNDLTGKSGGSQPSGPMDDSPMPGGDDEIPF